MEPLYIFILIFIAFLFCIIGTKSTISYSYHRRNKLLESPLFKETHSRLRPLLACLSESFDKFKIVWWLDSGSLLGYERHRGFIPHDDDIDVAVWIKDDSTLDTLETCYQYIRKEYQQFTVGKTISVAPDAQLTMKTDNTMFDIGTFIDIFYVKETNDIFYTNTISMMFWPKGYYYRTSTFPLQQVTFEGSTAYIPCDPKRYLYQMYGEDCMKVMKVQHLHCANSIWDALAIQVVSDIPIFYHKK